MRVLHPLVPLFRPLLLQSVFRARIIIRTHHNSGISQISDTIAVSYCNRAIYVIKRLQKKLDYASVISIIVVNFTRRIQYVNILC